MDQHEMYQFDLGKTAYDTYAKEFAINDNWNDLSLKEKFSWIVIAEAIRDKVHE